MDGDELEGGHCLACLEPMGRQGFKDHLEDCRKINRKEVVDSSGTKILCKYIEDTPTPFKYDEEYTY